jgi:hypothetical protein
LQTGYTSPHAQSHAVVSVQLREHGTDLGTENTLEWDRCRLDEHDVGAHLAGGGRDLRPDPPGSDDSDPRRTPDRVTQMNGVVRGP